MARLGSLCDEKHLKLDQKKGEILIKNSSTIWRSRPAQIRFDHGRHWRARIGFVILAMEQTIEEDVFRLAPTGVGIHFSRMRMANEITVDTFEASVTELSTAASLILPDGNLSVICYACTSGSVVIGEDRVMRELSKGAPGARATTLITGVVRALRTLGAQRLAVATPYLDEINSLEANYLETQGFEVIDIQGLNICNDSDIVRVEPDFIREYARTVDRPEADALFVSCGALRTLDIVDALEREVQKPVVASNQAMIWDTLRLAGIEDKIEGYGQLLRNH